MWCHSSPAAVSQTPLLPRSISGPSRSSHKEAFSNPFLLPASALDLPRVCQGSAGDPCLPMPVSAGSTLVTRVYQGDPLCGTAQSVRSRAGPCRGRDQPSRHRHMASSWHTLGLRPHTLQPHCAAGGASNEENYLRSARKSAEEDDSQPAFDVDEAEFVSRDQDRGSSAGSSGAAEKKKKEEDRKLSEWYEREFAKPAERVWETEKEQVYYFAVANAQSLLEDGALVEEVLSDAITRANRGGRPRDVWMVMEPAFLEHPKLAGLKNALPKPTAAIISTNGPWMMSTVRELLPQATIGKFYAPTPSLPNPFLSTLDAGGAVIGGGAVWH